MLGTAAIINAIAEELRAASLPNYVHDPVMVATSGDLLIEREAVDSIRRRLIPLATLVTPNADEAAVLLGARMTSLAEMRDAARAAASFGANAVLIKGGHVGSTGDEVIDVLYDGEFTEYENDRLATTSTHGTGCTLSAAIAANLALGATLREAVAASIEFVHSAIATAPGLGSGHGPLNHFAGSDEMNSRTMD
jgi:hydroxymethylpyrimidine/phosphomethylpyrimidine kinase